jgi:hypothetical protein
VSQLVSGDIKIDNNKQANAFSNNNSQNQNPNSLRVNNFVNN